MIYRYPFKNRLFFIFLLCSYQLVSVAQTEPAYKINSSYNGLSTLAFIDKAEKELNVHFFYQKDSLPVISFVVTGDSMTLEQVLTANFATYKMYVATDKNGNFFLTSNRIRPSLPDNFYSAWGEVKEVKEDSTVSASSDYLVTKRQIGIKTLYVGNKKKGAYSEDVIMSGYLKNSATGEKIIGATLYFVELRSGTATDATGFFSYQLKKGKYTLQIQSAEYEEKKFILEVYSSDQVTIFLPEKINALKEVVITAEGTKKLETTTMGVEKITTKSVKMIPKMMGENDIVKTTLLLPGVQSVGEGTAGFNVRGSPADQNVFYMNQIPVYNTSHLMGFFSAFTPNGISDLSLYKSSFPSQFGGHLASVFDITAREGNRKKFSMEGGISPVSGNLLAEGPITKEKSSYMVAVRSTYSNWALKLVNVDAIKNSRAGFQDGIANMSLGLNDKNRLNVSGYYSTDHIRLASLTTYDYQNAGGALKWSHFIKQKHTFDFSTVYSSYSYSEENSASANEAYKMDYALNHFEGKANLMLAPSGKHHLNIGANSILYGLDNGRYAPLNEDSRILPVRLKREKGLESGIYINEEWKPSAIFSVSAGLRYNFYSYFGPQDTYIYKEGEPLQVDKIIDTVRYPKNKVIKNYSAPDIRISAKYSINEFMAVKAAFNQVHQYIFMLSNTIAISPTDKWKLVDNHIKPMNGEQYSAGFFSEFKKGMYEFSTEFYYKTVSNLVEYKDGANLLVNKIPETDVLQGNLKSYGVEFMLKKNKGRLNGWVNYTFSRALVTIDGPRPEEQINFGKTYPANYDKPHAFNIVANYKFSHRLSISSNIVYATGRPITFPAAVYYQNEIPITHYSARNEYRIPDYFRVDLSVNLEGNLKSKKMKHSSWNFSIYNLLGRDNPYSVYFKQENFSLNGYQLSIFGSPIFSVTYNFKLGSYEE